jgi:hypothetical protein
MEEIKHLKIETVTHIFPKFMRMQGDVFDSCVHSFFARTDVGAGGATDSLVQSVCWGEPGCRDDRPRLPLTIGSPELALYLHHMHVGAEARVADFGCQGSTPIVTAPTSAT